MKGEELESVEPGDPFEMMGLRTVPNAGDTIQSVPSEDRARRLSQAREERLERIRLSKQSLADGTSSISSILSGRGGGDSSNDETIDDEYEELNLIVKADVQGTAEAVRDSIIGLGTGKVGVKVVFTGAGQITEETCSSPALLMPLF